MKPATKNSTGIIILASLMTLLALTVNNISLASNDYRSVVIQAVIYSSIALILLGSRWARMSFISRVISIIIALLAGWTFFDAVGRRLPFVLFR